jgi:hypothetical protein
LNKKQLLKIQNEHRIKYGLKPHKRLDKDFLYLMKIQKLPSKEGPYDEKDYGGAYQ